MNFMNTISVMQYIQLSRQFLIVLVKKKVLLFNKCENVLRLHFNVSNCQEDFIQKVCNTFNLIRTEPFLNSNQSRDF